MSGEDEEEKEMTREEREAAVTKLKDEGNLAFQRGNVLKRTTAGKQYISEAKSAYLQGIKLLFENTGQQEMLDTLSLRNLGAALHNNLTAVFLLENEYEKARATIGVTLRLQPDNAKALFRHAKALLEDEREGLPESNLLSARDALQKARQREPKNEEIVGVLKRIQGRVKKIEDARRVPPPEEIIAKVPGKLRKYGGDCLKDYGYVWGQTTEVVHIFVPVQGQRLQNNKDVQVEFKPTSVKLRVPEASGSPRCEGEINATIRPDECSWQLEDGGLLLHAELHKARFEHWKRVWKGHPKTTEISEEEERDLQEAAEDEARKRSEEMTKAPPGSKAAETLKKLREMCPGTTVEWGDTSLDNM
eukprot:gnl/MRDRNA2_/MRDRNA2_54521_c0_seq1.p1 gnl/MRDRNA2_/MRDRNA2_54521_c0~~gnl/MRDRNA2_/MRDRNA2_54521_c0_seq1.p1  ORF type:complete len:361 (+),score=108.45 gnl/MRDRNA2_/MRDRNA2_54521_c0_seq1:79-1161(+)